MDAAGRDPADRWIVIPNWDKFQHYKNRDVPWIKLYLELAHKPEWLELSFAARGLLVTVWIEYAHANGRLSARTVPTNCTHKARKEHWDSLIRAGFIQFSSRPCLAHSRTRARESLRDSKKAAPNGYAAAFKEALTEAEAAAELWAGGDSDQFEVALDQICRRHHTRFPYKTRSRLWEMAFDRGRR